MRTSQVQTGTVYQATLDEDAVAELRQSFQGELVTPRDASYDETRKVWNGLIDKHPALIARCGSTADVSAAVNFARRHEVLLSVRGGGHNVAGQAVCDEGLVIDLSPMRDVRVDPAQRVVQVQGGATLGDIDRATQPFGLAVPVGLVSATGIGGLTLHGGMGWLTRKHGLTIDNLISVEIVTADGQRRRAGETEHPDLFWALRGGGGNFGIVTSFEFRAHAVGPEVWFLATIYPISQARHILQFARDFMAEAPEELGLLASLWSAPEDESIPREYRRAPVLVLLGCYQGPPAAGEQITRPLRRLGTPLTDLSTAMPFEKVQTFLDADYPEGGLYYWKSAYLKDLSENAMDLLIDHTLARPSWQSSLDIWYLGGAMNRVPADRTAFARRDMAHLIGIEANWTDPGQSDANIAWARRVFEDMQQFSQGTYLNFPGFMEDGDKLLQGAYEANYERLLAIKTKYDPDNLFHGALNIVPVRRRDAEDA
jgi:FAD/FMN-containing dehydrogenase